MEGSAAAGQGRDARMKPLLSIQYLRAGAALTVVIYHALQWGTGGFDVGRAGVDVFFVISGVIMWTVTDGKVIPPGLFLWRRITRVVPLYWLASVAVAAGAVAWPGFLPQILADWRHLGLSLAFIPHLDPRGRPFPTLPPGWSLNYEAIFYLIFALALAGPPRWRAWTVSGGLTGIVAAGLLARIPIYVLGANPMLLQFAAGLWLAVALRRRALPSAPWGVCMILLALAGWTLVQAGGLFVELWRPLLWGGPAALLVAGALSLEQAGAVPDWPWLRRLGDASYSIYLLHLPAVALVAHMVGPQRVWLFLPLALAASIIAGLAGWRLIERPATAALRSRERLPVIKAI